MSASFSNTPSRIVAGVDGSPESVTALRWAIRQARLTGGVVNAVIAWQLPVEMSGWGWSPMTAAECADLVEAARRTLETAIGQAAGDGDRPYVQALVEQGFPAQVLLEASKNADLLVVGSRGHGLFADTLLGTVGQHCFHHAHCPVVVMRGEPATQAA